MTFQSTLPGRGATSSTSLIIATPKSFSIHAPRAGSDYTQYGIAIREFILSIHAPRAGSDTDNNS